MITNLIVAHLAAFMSPLDGQPKVRFGKYEATLRIPTEGLFAQEETDVEFRVVDTTQKDPVEEGFKGVGAIDASATMTMPAMAGMPAAKPTVHREGVPGDYGIVLYFPHGGDYKLDLKLNIPGDGTKNVSFSVRAKDERPPHLKQKQPYRLEVVDWPKNAPSSQAQTLKLRVIDAKTNQTVKAFDESHTKRFHLLLASKDLNWFVHDHPEMQSDGTWVVKQKFPAGGDYWVYGDVAPAEQGARVLMTKVSLTGPKPKWDTKPRIQSVSVDQGLQGAFSSLEPIQVGRSATIQIKLFDTKNWKSTPIKDQYLGALGHLMIFSKDGQTVVHSHPFEDAASLARASKGVVWFSARFPKPGYYKAYAQFNWHGGVRTLGFGIQVKG